MYIYIKGNIFRVPPKDWGFFADELKMYKMCNAEVPGKGVLMYITQH